jgi:cobalamin biosynthesis protein CobT
LIERAFVKKDVQVVRESIAKIVSMLTGRRVRVKQQGTKAFVAYRPDGSIEVVHLPYIPDDASDEFIAAIQGYLDHEVGHALHSDHKVLFAAKKCGRRVANVANIIEDVFIERKMSETFRGSSMNLDSVRSFYLHRIVEPKIKEALAEGNKAEAAGYAFVVGFRAWGGQIAAVDFLREHPEVQALLDPFRAKIGEALVERIGRCANSQDCLDLAKEVVAKLAEKPPAPKPKPAAPAPKAPPPPPAASEEPEEPEDGDGSASACETRSEADDGDEEHESSAAEEGGREPGEGESKGDAAMSSDDTEPEPEPETGPSYEEGGEDEAPSEEPGEEEGEEEAPAPGLGTEHAGGDEAGDGEGEGDDFDADDDDEAGMGGPGGDTRGVPEAAGVASGDEEDALPDPGIEEDHEDLGSAFDEERDFDKAMGDELTKKARKEMTEADYRTFSQEWDRIEPGPLATSPDAAARMVERTQHMISGMQKHLERAMAAEDKRGWSGGKRRGRLSPGALYKTAVGDERVFRRRYERLGKNTVVSLLVDCSGSMQHGDRIGTAGLTAFALASTLERLKVQYEVLGFTTYSSGEYVAAMRADGGIAGSSYGRYEPLYVPVFKPFNERLSSDNISRLAHLTERPRWLQQNVDGECLALAAHRLRQQRGERRVLIVLSDGAPCCPGGGGLPLHLEKTAKRLNDSGVETIGIGIQTESVRYYYDKHVVLDDLGSLPTTVMAQLTKVLLS